jgi:hypothetical protein
MRIRAGFEPHRGRTTALKLGRIPERADLNGTPHPTAQIRRGPVSEVVAVVRAEIFALPFAVTPTHLLNPGFWLLAPSSVFLPPFLC